MIFCLDSTFIHADSMTARIFADTYTSEGSDVSYETIDWFFIVDGGDCGDDLAAATLASRAMDLGNFNR